jgi:hypothetical protein
LLPLEWLLPWLPLFPPLAKVALPRLRLVTVAITAIMLRLEVFIV